MDGGLNVCDVEPEVYGVDPVTVVVFVEFHGGRLIKTAASRLVTLPMLTAGVGVIQGGMSLKHIIHIHF